jgi:endonuclease-3
VEHKARLREILKRLRKAYPKPKVALTHSNVFELLVATMLSAQTTDAQVNRITPALFAKYPSVEAFARARPESLEAAVSSVNFYRTKARNIRNSARMIIERHGGDVPKTMDELTALPGIARKTANIILSSGFGVIEGIAVDTHVIRLSGRLGLTKHTDPARIEADLMEAIPRKAWPEVTLLLIRHGRDVCKARKPVHEGCVLATLCPSRDA